MVRRNFFAIVLLALMLPAAAPVAIARGDEVILHNGDRVSGVVTGIKDGRVTIEQTKFGTISASLSDVKTINPAPTTQPATQPTTAKAQSATQPATQASTKPVATQASTQPTSPPASQPTTTVATKPATPPPAAPPPKPPPVKRWSGAITATALATRGNSNSESIRVSVDALRKGDKNTLTLAAGYALGQTEDATGANTTNIDNWFASAKLDYAFNEKWYNYALVRVEEDNVANLALRVSPGIGVGYRWINKPEVHFNTEMGVSYVWEEFDNNGTNEHVALRLAYHFDKKLNDKVSLVHNVEYLPSVEDLGDFNLNADLGIRAQLTTNMFGEFKAEWRHDASPAPGASQNDLRYTVGVGWKF